MLKFMYFQQERHPIAGIVISHVQKSRVEGSDSTCPLHLSQRSNENARHRNCIVTDLKQIDPSKAA
ncbi:hypothetical protein JVX98_11215 [Ensifer sp. PDNC004]|uniref:hypothetical protein n=1 Tax=Ensifer sp. PDNC004 TaxID=2811423 RepID=UPI0019640AAF|nr:hypothetical protein [Ensifer sp. PDNC004]QRY68809.1 hypothetical protein JVX98_11215 [Ensifer sp. PDNC004]